MLSTEHLARLGLLIGAPLVFLALAECVLLVLGLPKSENDPNFAEMVRTIDAQEIFYDVDPELFWKLRPNLVARGEATTFRTNAQGLRGAAVQERAVTPRVLLLGDSVTFGYGLDENATFAHQLHELLREDGRPVEVVNAGVPGYSSFQGLVLGRRLVGRLRPDLVVISFGFNDARDLFSSDAEVAKIGAATRGLRKALFHSRLYRLLRAWIVRPNASAGRVVARVSPEEYARNLHALVETVRREGAHVFLLETPFQRDTRFPYGPSWFTLHEPIEAYRRQARAVAQTAGIRYVGAGPLNERAGAPNDGWFLDPAHPNELGARVLAESLRAAMREHDWAVLSSGNP